MPRKIVPDLQPQAIDYTTYREAVPEKLELIGGYLISGPEYPDSREKLLRALLINVGLERAVQLAPREKWQTALREKDK